eukprot:3063611-Rhodomonas_salina.2
MERAQASPVLKFLGMTTTSSSTSSSHRPKKAASIGSIPHTRVPMIGKGISHQDGIPARNCYPGTRPDVATSLRTS